MAKNYVFNFYIYDEDDGCETLIDEAVYFISYKRAIRFMYKKIKADILDFYPDFKNFTDGNELLTKLMANETIKLQYNDLVYNYQLLGA